LKHAYRNCFDCGSIEDAKHFADTPDSNNWIRQLFCLSAPYGTYANVVCSIFDSLSYLRRTVRLNDATKRTRKAAEILYLVNIVTRDTDYRTFREKFSSHCNRHVGLAKVYTRSTNSQCYVDAVIDDNRNGEQFAKCLRLPSNLKKLERHMHERKLLMWIEDEQWPYEALSLTDYEEIKCMVLIHTSTVSESFSRTCITVTAPEDKISWSHAI
jgi:hypothetical protein